jgi:NAD(P)-dependent dehydrogenase (short-subunit alcohol dehydrogenase family)
MTGQVWFITGSSRGLGRSVAEEALAAGRRVVATARPTSTLDDLAGRYRGRRGRSWCPRKITCPSGGNQGHAACTRQRPLRRERNQDPRT